MLFQHHETNLLKVNIYFQWKHRIRMQWTLASINTMIRNTIPAYMIQIKVASGLYVWSFRTDLPTMRDFNKWICSLNQLSWFTVHDGRPQMKINCCCFGVLLLELCDWKCLIQSWNCRFWICLTRNSFGHSFSTSNQATVFQQLVGLVEIIERHGPLAAVPTMQS